MCCFFFFQAEDGIRDLVRSRGLGDVYKRQVVCSRDAAVFDRPVCAVFLLCTVFQGAAAVHAGAIEFAVCVVWPVWLCRQCADVCLLYTSDAADERSSVDLGGRRIIKKKKRRRKRG